MCAESIRIRRGLKRLAAPKKQEVLSIGAS